MADQLLSERVRVSITVLWMLPRRSSFQRKAFGPVGPVADTVSTSACGRTAGKQEGPEWAHSCRPPLLAGRSAFKDSLP